MHPVLYCGTVNDGDEVDGVDEEQEEEDTSIDASCELGHVGHCHSQLGVPSVPGSTQSRFTHSL